MFESIKNKIAEFVIKHKLKGKRINEKVSFTGFFKKSFTFLALMPADENDFNKSLIVLDYLIENKKHPTILTNDYRISLIPQKYRNRVIDFNINNLNRLDIPNKELINKLKQLQVNAVIDLNRDSNLLYSYISNIVDANIRIGFSKTNSDKYYNLQFSNKSENPEESYKNFISCLEMF